MDTLFPHECVRFNSLSFEAVVIRFIFCSHTRL